MKDRVGKLLKSGYRLLRRTRNLVPGRRFWRKASVYSIAGMVGLFLLFLALDRLFPLPLKADQHQYSAIIVAKDGTPLRAFADDNGVWRYPVKLKQVSPLYLQALLNYEDRYFYYHPGINPGALLRAAWQRLVSGRIVSGGSTITMQVARLIDPHKRTVTGKLRQMFRALQLEWHWDKKKILTYYVNHAPFGGTYEGVEAASRAYLGKSSRLLSHAEAALLAVLPQSPTRFRPDRNAVLAEQARNKVIKRLVDFGVWSRTIATDARIEKVSSTIFRLPVYAPLFAQRLKPLARKKGIVRTTIDAHLQTTIEQRLSGYLASLPARTSIAILVVENSNLKVRTYIGTADFANRKRFGHVDMVTARRSPGSTLKPFLYAFAIEDGMVHSESLLSDAPVEYKGYRPSNFHGNFRGPVSVRAALQLSLNIPAVQLMYHYGAAKFAARARNGGLILQMPPHAKPNLSIILGGAGTSLESLVTAYTAFGRKGVSGKLRFTDKDPLVEHRMFNAGAAWIIKQVLMDNSRPGISQGYFKYANTRRVAWKTGTSYGYRDAWAVGVTERYTIGIWVGRPDGTPMPGHYGAITAAPILFDVVDSLPNRDQIATAESKPANVRQVKICWPTGTEYRETDKQLCHQKKTAWILNDVIPPTLPDINRKEWLPRKIKYWINPKTGLLVNASCKTRYRLARWLARWPDALEPWLTADIRRKARKPRPDPSCRQIPEHSRGTLKITGLSDETVIRQSGPNAQAPVVELYALGGQGKLYWIINGKLARIASLRQPVQHRFDKTGYYQITVTDHRGQFDTVNIKVIE